ALLRVGVQRLGDRNRNGFHLIDLTLDLLQQRAWSRRCVVLPGRALRRGYATVFAEDGLVAADAGHEVTGQAGQLVVAVEYQADALLQALAAARLDAVEVIPAVGMEGIGDQRVTHDKPHLAPGHSGAQLVYHVLSDDIALLNVDLVNPGE